MITILKDVPVPGIEVVPCRQNGPRGIVKAFLLSDAEGLILIDTGFSAADADLIRERIERAGHGLRDLRQVLLTHGHRDHTGGLARLLESARPDIVCHEAEAESIQHETGIVVDRRVRDGDRLPECGGMLAIHMPGHTAGSVAFYLEEARALFAGDAIVSAGEHLIVCPPFLCDDPAQARVSVQRLLDRRLPIERVFVSHGDDVYQDAYLPLARILLERRGAG